MNKNSFQEANMCLACQNISHILWNPQVHYRIHKSHPPASILSHIKPVHTSIQLLDYLFWYYTPSSLCLGLSLIFATKTVYASLLSLYVPHAPPISHSINLITRIMFGEEYKSWCSSLCNLHPVSYYLVFLRPKCLYQTMLSKTSVLVYVLHVETKCHNRTK